MEKCRYWRTLKSEDTLGVDKLSEAKPIEVQPSVTGPVTIS
jgi:hypothetical protein